MLVCRRLLGQNHQVPGRRLVNKVELLSCLGGRSLSTWHQVIGNVSVVIHGATSFPSREFEPQPCTPLRPHFPGGSTVDPLHVQTQLHAVASVGDAGYTFLLCALYSVLESGEALGMSLVGPPSSFPARLFMAMCICVGWPAERADPVMTCAQASATRPIARILERRSALKACSLAFVGPRYSNSVQ